MGDSFSTEEAWPDMDAKEALIPVSLNIYALGTNGAGRFLNSLLSPLGTGAFHCGVEIMGCEWSFRSTPGWKGNGVFWCPPQQCKSHTFVESIHMGYCRMSDVAIMTLVQDLTSSWPAADYHVLRRNCCHFSDEVCKRLGVGGIPHRFMSLADACALPFGPLCDFVEEEEDFEVLACDLLEEEEFEILA
uniref:PPPDE domain-containing protein n=1 Tax=Alexandrium catenella TaxID=2925 RepID=A0A7S1WW80_ALECA|mmetsp:Transcript_95925/g.254821  ORF Transcript_95925/g.254821 Transcript_95925/m.254821 type:complete len:189 (+) Transcript_95925:83-649(+)